MNDEDRIDRMLDTIDVTICPDCNGEGVILICCDDICAGLGHCIHGDGEAVCSRCNGQGELYATSE